MFGILATLVITRLFSCADVVQLSLTRCGNSMVDLVVVLKHSQVIPGNTNRACMRLRKLMTCLGIESRKSSLCHPVLFTACSDVLQNDYASCL
jgi:hypothetical protein